MTKRLIAMLIAVIMVLSLVACSNGDKLPDNTNDNQPSNSDKPNDDGNKTTDAGNSSNPDPEEVYTPDPDCPYRGYVAFGVASGTAYFDDIKVRDRGTGGFDLVPQNGFEDSSDLPAFKAIGSTDAVTPTIVDDPIQAAKEGAEITNHVVSVASGNLATGETIWNLYQYTIKVLPADENTVIEVFFAIQDANNYYVLDLGEEGNTKATAYKVTDGNKENAQFTIPLTLDLDKFTNIGININKDTITIYIAGEDRFDLYNANYVNDWYPYTPEGDVVPLSVSEKQFGAPGEGYKFYPVNLDNILHDGKGTWSNDVKNVATMAFDLDMKTYYDCDEENGSVPTEEVLVGTRYGDGSFETGYVGAYFETAFVLKAVRFCPRDTFSARASDGTIEASADGETWVKIGSIDDTPTEGTFNTYIMENDTAYNYYRYVGPSGGYCNVAEIEFWGIDG